MRLRRVALLLSLLAVAGPAGAATVIRVLSLNTRHYGWSDTTPRKIKTIRDLIAGRHTDVVVLQEVMDTATIGKLKPGDYQLFPSNDSFGIGSYQEYYLAMVAGFKITSEPREFPHLQKSFSRPPMALNVRTKTSPFYIANFHAIWGDHSIDRKDEALRIRTVWEPKLKSGNYVMVGDWNLSVRTMVSFLDKNHHPFDEIAPDDKTTITSDGEGYSKSYDHMATSAARLLDCDRIDPHDSLADWLTDVSDHLPIICEIRF